MVMLTDIQRTQIEDAVTQAESRTSGEIACILAHGTSHYREVPILWAADAALLLPPLALMLGFDPTVLVDVWPGWAAPETDPSAALRSALSSYALIQAILFGVVAFALSFAQVRQYFVPAFLKRHRVRQTALHHFAALEARTAGRPHVLIFASLGDRCIEILADAATQARAGDAPWREAVDAVTSGIHTSDAAGGFVRAVGIVGQVLAAHFPSVEEDANLLPNIIREI